MPNKKFFSVYNILTLGAANATDVRAKKIAMTFMFETARLNARYKKISSDIYTIFRYLYAMFRITSYEKKKTDTA